MPSSLSSAPIGSSDRHGVRAGPVLDHADALEEVGAGLVHLVDEHDARNLVAVSLTPDGFGLRLNAGVAVQKNDSTVKHGQRTFDFDGEVDVAGGVDDVEAVLRRLVAKTCVGIDLTFPEGGRGSRGDRDAAFLLLLHPVHRGGAVMDFADLVGLAGVVKDTFRVVVVLPASMWAMIPKLRYRSSGYSRAMMTPYQR